MDEIALKATNIHWAAPIYIELFMGQVELHCLDHFTKKLHRASFMNLLLYVQIYKTESLRAFSVSEKLQTTGRGFMSTDLLVGLIIGLSGSIIAMVGTLIGNWQRNKHEMKMSLQEITLNNSIKEYKLKANMTSAEGGR